MGLRSALKKLGMQLLTPFLRVYVREELLTPDSALAEYLRHYLIYERIVFGDEARLHVAATAVLNNALLNVTSGEIFIEDYVFFGHNVCLLTGTHDYKRFNRERQEAIPQVGRDIIVQEGAWIASNATILGPCRIGRHAVVAAGAVVTCDVPPFTVVAGHPAQKVREIPVPPAEDGHDG